MTENFVISDVVEVTEEFGVPETKTLQHFAKPKPPRNHRKPKKSANKITPMISEEDQENDSEEKVILRQKIMTELTNNLKTPEKTNSFQVPNSVEKNESKRASDIFTRRLRSQSNDEGIENPTSL